MNNIEQALNVEWLKCHHGVLKSHFCHECHDERERYKQSFFQQATEPPKRIPIYKGCYAAQHGGCFCTGDCKTIVGYRDPIPGEIHHH